MHVRHGTKASSIPCSKTTLEVVSKKMYQHRSLALALPRTSTTIFNSKRVDWSCDNSKSPEPSIVYNCRSDTETLPKEDDDILLSTTYFTHRPWTFATMYGCPLDFTKEVVTTVLRFKRSAFHPLMFPIIFVEYERTRFMKALSSNNPKLNQRILDLENRLETDKKHKDRPSDESNREMTKRDCESTKLWVDASDLKNGLESLKKVLHSIDEHSHTFKELTIRPNKDGTNEKIQDSASSESIAWRLREMISEAECKIRSCEGLLNGMALAIQMEWNYHTRRDANANIFIAYASREDSYQMRLISLVGMIFLPGTFLATLFSMSFFRWIPDNSADVVSPWLAIYFGLTAIITGATFWCWKTWKGEGIKKFVSEMDGDTWDTGDVEKGSMYSNDSQRTRVNREDNNHDGVQTAVIAGSKRE
ncbi:hypothetical protein F5Y04DRAFT_265548 [Hypomontagnella monticulosa]|nr:hypothetical protein F5Y04DRAFT_265548 [Hypomontagnella monticulosa]